MKTMFIGSEEVSNLLSMSDCIVAMREVFTMLAKGEAVLPPRSRFPNPNGKGIISMMPGYLGYANVFGLKAISVFPGNEGTPFGSHQGAVLLFDNDHGSLLCIADASAITRIRTAAASGVATDLLANKEPKTLAVLGSGTQASSHIDAMLNVRKSIDRVVVWSRTRSHAEKFARLESDRLGRKIVVVDDPKTATVGADIICTTTGSTSPIIKGEWLSPGTHINAVGASVPPHRELDSVAIKMCRFFADRREAVLTQSDDLLVPIKEGVITKDHLIAEIGELLLGKASGRLTPQDITVFKSLGMAVEDLASAYFVYEKARKNELGEFREFNEER
jgi:ornithine cyclodeaminase/alanine dehydrogenase-like protein (mu-crystallin family)